MFEIFNDLCKQNGVKPTTVARECGIDPSTISHWKKGLWDTAVNGMSRRTFTLTRTMIFYREKWKSFGWNETIFVVILLHNCKNTSRI